MQRSVERSVERPTRQGREKGCIVAVDRAAVRGNSVEVWLHDQELAHGNRLAIWKRAARSPPNAYLASMFVAA